MTRCGTCTSACCRAPGPVLLTAADIERLGAARAQLVTPTDLPGGHFVGQLERAPDGACVFLLDDGCAVHEVKPEACRTFDAETCGLYQPDARKVLGLVRLRSGKRQLIGEP